MGKGKPGGLGVGSWGLQVGSRVLRGQKVETGWANSDDPTLPPGLGARFQWAQGASCDLLGARRKGWIAALCGGVWRWPGRVCFFFGKTTGTSSSLPSPAAHELHDPRNPRTENSAALLAAGTPGKGGSRPSRSVSRLRQSRQLQPVLIDFPSYPPGGFRNPQASLPPFLSFSFLL